MNSVIGALRVVLGADTAAFEKGLSGAQKTLNKFNRDMQKLSAKFTSVGQSLTVGLTVPIAAFGAASVRAAQESADAFAQVEAALKSMGGASGKTSEELQASAKALQRMAAIDDDEILRKVTANLLTFGNVSGPVFDRAQAAILDVATRLKMDLQPATILVGKALNDPIKGLTAMGRAGIQFTAEQKAMIKTMVDVGNVAGAQAIILGELEGQFGGSAKAAADVNPYAKLKVAFDELSETVGEKLAPVLLPLVTGLTNLLNKFDALSPAAQKFILVGGAIAAALGPALIVIGSLISAVGTIAAFMAGPLVASFMAALVPLAPIIAGIAALVAVFLLFRKQIMPVLAEWGETVAEVLGPKIGPLVAAVGDAFKALGELLAPLFKPSGAVGGALLLFLDVLTRVVGSVTALLGGALDFITEVFRALAAGLRGDWSAMWGHLGKAVMGLLKGVLGAFAAFAPEVVNWGKKTFEGIKLWLVDKFVTIVKAVAEKCQAVAGFFKALWDAVVGHSYVPDMVEGIQNEFARLDRVMVDPARRATAAVSEAYQNMAADVARAMNLPALSSGSENTASDVNRTRAANDNVVWGGKVMTAEQAQELREKFVGFGKDLVGAIKSGDLQGFFAQLGERAADRLIEVGLNALFDALKKVGGNTGGGGGGDWLSSLMSLFSTGGMPGFATGGSFTVGGSGGIDSQLVAFRATPGEMVDIRHGNSAARGGTNVFDLRGAVVTQDLLDQMNRIANEGDARTYARVNSDKFKDQQAARYRVARGGR